MSLAIGYCRVSTAKQAEHGVSLEAQAEKIRAMANLHDATLLDIVVDEGESAKSLKRPGLERVLNLVDTAQVQSVIVAKLDRLTRSVKDLCDLLERFERRKVALISVAESLDTGSAAGQTRARRDLRHKACLVAELDIRCSGRHFHALDRISGKLRGKQLALLIANRLPINKETRLGVVAQLVKESIPVGSDASCAIDDCLTQAPPGSTADILRICDRSTSTWADGSFSRASAAPPSTTTVEDAPASMRPALISTGSRFGYQRSGQKG